MNAQRRMNLFLNGAAAIGMAAAAFWDGLYAPGQQLAAVGVLAAAVLILQARARLTWWEWSGSLLILGGALLSLGRAVSPGTAAHGPFLVAGWLLALLLGRQLDRQWAGRAEAALGLAAATTGALMLFGGLAAISYLPPHHSGRLASFLGYPNAVGILGLLGFVCALPLGTRGTWRRTVLAFSNGAAVILSGSRGVWAAALLLAVYVWWAAPALIRRGVLPAVWAFAAALWVGPAVAAADRFTALGAALLGLVGALATDRLAAWWRRAEERLAHAAWAGAGLFLTVLWAAALAAAPGWGWFLGRAGALPLTEGSSVERWVLLQDGFRLARSFPLGAGLGGWAALQLQHASYGYYSAEVHSAPLELALSFGWAGAVGFLMLLIRFWWGLQDARGWTPERTALLGGLGALGLHAMLDWDLSYGFFMLLLFTGFGLMERPRLERAGRFWPTVLLATGALLGVLVLGAGDLFTEAADRSLAAGNWESARLHATAAVSANPWNDQSQASLGRAFSALGERQAAVAAFQKARRLAPLEPWYAELLGRELLASGRLREAAAAYRALPALWPWHVPAYERALDAHVTMLLEAEWLGDQELAQEVRESGWAVLEALDRQKALEPPGMPRAPMEVDTPTIRRAREALGIL